MIRFEDPTTLSLLFHLNSEPWLNDEAYRSAAYHQEFKDVASEGRVALPSTPESGLARLLRERRSCRAYRAQTMPLTAVAALASAAYGAVEVTELPDRTSFLRRSVPSAGGLFPLEIFVFAQRVEGLPDGLHHYDVRGHELRTVRRGNLIPDLEPVLYTYPFIRNANLIFALSAVFHRTQKKYGPRGYRYVLLEAGHVAQNVCLAAAEQDLSTLCMGGFVDSRFNRMLGLEPTLEGVVYTVAAGYAAPGE
jgi:SagB-type dehydrogenase family enzyme